MTNNEKVPVTDKKRVKISSKRQITIPQTYYTMLGFEDAAECVVRGNELVIRPVHNISSGEFSEQILADLIKEGFTGNELLEKFKERQAKVRPAVEAMIAEAEKAANGETEYSTYEDIFGTED